jgi:hypothetical protein
MGEAAPQRRKRANKGFTQTTYGVPSDPEILWKVSHKFYPGPMVLDFSVRMGTGVSIKVTLLLTLDSCTLAKVFWDITDM